MQKKSMIIFVLFVSLISQTMAQETEQKKKNKGKHKQPATEIIDRTLNFDVENKTGKTQYVTCFSYMKKHTFDRWRWIKSPIYEIRDDQQITVKLPPVDDDQDRENTYGYLAVFNDREEAEDAVFELLPDKNKLELDMLIQLKGKKVVLEVEKYGFLGEFYDYDFVPEDHKAAEVPSLDFVVENQTGKTVIVTCFVFEKKAKGTWLAERTRLDWAKNDEAVRDDMAVWRFDKSPIITLKNGESGKITVDTIIEGRDRNDVRGYLAIFDEDERDKAEKAIYELLPAQNKLQLNKLTGLKNKKVVLQVEEYGIMDDSFDYKVKPIKRIDFTKIGQPHATN